jgi:TetR/AcrR family transcriptional regulator, ethionamide resistance regulator
MGRARRSEDQPRSPRLVDRPRGPGAQTAILDAAERLLANSPLHELSVARVIEEAGISRATFYFYFRSKFAVLTALVARVTDEMYEAIAPYVSSADLHGRIETSAEVWGAHWPVLRATVENWHASEDLRALWLGVVQRMAGGVAAEIGRRNGSAGPDSRQLASVLAWTTERCLYIAGLDSDGDLDDNEALVGVLTRMWLATLYSSPGAAAA